jgi:hypothetical protein
MRWISTLPSIVTGGLLLAACGGDSMDEAATSDMDVAAGDALGCYIAQGTEAEAQERPSPLRRTAFAVGGSDALLCYGAPSARGRDIMGGLLVYGQPERIGANETTTIHLSGPAVLETLSLAAGSYSIYAIAGEDEWEFFVNSNWQRWGIPISPEVRSADVGSFTVTPESTDSMVETLTYSFRPTAEGLMGDMVLEWENTRVKFHVHPGA